jgi:hypothetical protein
VQVFTQSSALAELGAERGGLGVSPRLVKPAAGVGRRRRIFFHDFGPKVGSTCFAMRKV